MLELLKKMIELKTQLNNSFFPNICVFVCVYIFLFIFSKFFYKKTTFKRIIYFSVGKNKNLYEIPIKAYSS